MHRNCNIKCLRCELYVMLLNYLFRESGLSAMRSGRPAGICLADFEHAMSVVQPSAMREIYIDVPKVTNRSLDIT